MVVWCYTSDLSELTDFYNVKIIRKVHIGRCHQYHYPLGGVCIQLLRNACQSSPVKSDGVHIRCHFFVLHECTSYVQVQDDIT